MRGGDHVHATDGGIGQVQGLVIDSGSHQITYVLLQTKSPTCSSKRDTCSAVRTWRSRLAP
jgi:hypothetical protein